MAARLDYLVHLSRESARFAECMASADPSTPVPSCPDWNAADLLWHISEVQLFWAAIVRERLAEPDTAEADKPARPTDWSELLDLFATANAQLTSTLESTDDQVAVWNWSGDDQTVAFVRRRQAHEALIHRLDAELVIGAVTDFDPILATDGVDEALTVMHGGWPAWAEYAPHRTGRVVATDSGRCWNFTLGLFDGTSPNTGRAYHDPTLEVVQQLPATGADFTVSGGARDLDAWFWGRPVLAELEVVGSREVFAELETLVGLGLD